MERFVDQDFTKAEFRECAFDRARFVGVVMQDAEIDGLITNLVVNGVEVMGFVEAELDRRYPVRLLIRSDSPVDLRDAWQQIQRDWTATIDRLRAEPGIERRSVNGEWSAIETLRHLVFVHDSWFRRCVLGSTAPFTPIGLGIQAVSGRESNGLDPAADPDLDEVVEVRAEQTAELARWLSTVTPDQLAATAPVPDDDVWPPYARGRSVRRCLGTVLNEEWEHHGFCVRDLDLIAAAG
jgi:hypothetical protein